MSKLTLHCAITAENGKRVTISIDNNPTTTTPNQLRTQVATATKIPLSQLRLIFRGRMIKDDDNNVNVVKEYKLEDECVLHCMGKPNNDATSTVAAAATTTTPPAPSVANAPTISATTTTTPSATATAATTTTPAAADPLLAALELLRTHASSPDVYTTALTTLDKILSNIISHPMEEKYRKVKVHNAAFGKRLGNLVGGKQAMLAVGFIETTDNENAPIYKMQASPEAWPALQQAKMTLEQALTRAKQATATNTASSNTPSPMMFPNPTGTTTGTTGFPGMPGSGIPNNNPMAAAAMAQNILSNPEALQNMMQNPMVQQMIQNDPNIPPHARQAMQSLSNNPAMMNQLSQMMMNNDPMVRNQMMQSMGGTTAGGTGMPGGGTMMPNLMPGMSNMGGNAANTNNNNNSANNNNNNSGGEGNDESTTEDEMIAEAIRRSLEES